MSRWNLAWLLGITGVVLLGYTVSNSAPTREKDRDYELVRLVVDVLDEVEHKYVRPLDPDAKRKLVEDMINGGLSRLDPHSGFINPREYKRFAVMNKGKFGGVGIQLGDPKNSYLTVASPMIDTPAYEAGILPGDLILKIDGKSTHNMPVIDAVDLITGEPGTKVVLSVIHEGKKEPIDVELTRAEIEVPSVLGDLRDPQHPREWDYMLDKTNKIGYIRVISFSENTAKELRGVVEKLLKQGARGLVLDLRANPGGLLRAAVEVSRMFIPEGRIVSTRGRDQQEEVYDARGDNLLVQPEQNFPIAILIDHLSASASEIVAAAMQDHHRAVIVGERSYGKGSVQNVIEMEDRKSALKLTTASYWRPSGKNIHRFPDSKETDEWGVQPNDGLGVKLSDEERRDYYRYRQQRDILKSKSDETSPDKLGQEKSEAKPFSDKALDKALDFVHRELKHSDPNPPRQAANS
jgi:carboxyl-terminal processing protease